MKKGLLLLLLAGFTLVSCDQVGEIENFAVNHKFEKSMVLDVSATDPSTFASDFTIETSDDDDFKNNLSKISKYTVSTFSYRIASFNGDESITSTGIVQFMDGASAIGDPIDLGVVNFRSLQNSGLEVEIPVSDDLKTLVQNKLLSNNSISVRVSGEVSDKPLTAEFVLGLKIEALVSVK